MLYHAIHRPLHQTTTKISDQSTNNSQDSGLVPPSMFMPRYHYSRIVPNNATNDADAYLSQETLDGHLSKPLMTATTTTTSNNQNAYGPFKSTFIPLAPTNRTITPTRRDFIQIPVKREDGTSITTNNPTRSVPITFISQTNAVPPGVNNNNNNNENTTSKANFTNLLRPSSRYFQHHFNNATENQMKIPTTTTTTAKTATPTTSIHSSSLPRLPVVTRRLSLTIPVMTTTVITNNDDDDDDSAIKTTASPSPMRRIPVRLSQGTSTNSNSANTSRTSSAILRSSSLSNPFEHQKIEINETPIPSSTLFTVNNSQQPSSSDFTLTNSNISPIRRAEAMAREAIQGMARLQQQRNSLISDTNNNTHSNNQSPNLSRRVIINLKNNQSISLDSRLSSAMKPPPIPSSSSRTTSQRNNFFHIPVLHEIQVPSHSIPIITESTSQSSSVNNNINSENYKNEFHMEIPVTIVTSNDQENHNQQNNGKTDGINNHERIPSANPNSHQTLKSILKRSSSRETVSRKNVSFVNA